MSALDPREYAVLAAEAAAEKKATDVVILDVASTIVITEYFVLASGNSDRQVRMIAEEIEAQLKAAGRPVIGREGEREGKWVLLDFADVVVHVFLPEEREFYRLEKLWSDAPRVELPAEIANLTEKPAADQEEPLES
ncbi:MAG: ribosome silencing factor [Coriobacteriia bacterium]|nr:ribosome silencing factor [Coriobacteriia bacterium]MBN2823476.1 ribosome silencing factor [Coriobacteriia bacterium]